MKKNKKNLELSTQRKSQLRKQTIGRLLKRAQSSDKGLKINKERTSKSRNQNKDTAAHPPDRVLIAVIAGLIGFGWVMIYSGSFYVASQQQSTIFFPNNPYHFFILQGMWIVLGVVAAYITYRIPIEAYKAFVIPMMLVVVGLLILVLVRDTVINSAKQWILIGPFSMQPSEFAKPVVIILLASLLSTKASLKLKNYTDFLKKRVLPFALTAGVVVGLVLAGRDLATAALIAAIAGGIFFMSHNHIYTNASVIGLILLGVMFVVGFTLAEGYRTERVNTYLQVLETGEPANPLGSGYQLDQILTAVGSGGVDGYGFGQSRQKYYYLQETAFNDTIFAIVAEEFGFMGSLATVAAFALLIFRGLKVAQHANSSYTSLIALGVTLWFCLQAIIHLGVNVGLLPLTGMTLPFMSYGGSSLISCMIGVGLLLNVSKEVKLD